MKNLKSTDLIRLSRSIVGKAEADAVARILLEDGYLGMGSEVQKFENEIAAFLGIDSSTVVCVNSGTAALHLAVQSVIKPGEEVLVPSFTFLASYQAISAAGAIPVSCDIYEDTLTIDIGDAEKKLTSRTRGIMPVYYASNPGNIIRVYEFAEKNELRVIEDAAHAFGCKYKSNMIGSIGDIICFSFDGIKNITSGEGGAIISRDKRVLDHVKDSRLLGVIKDSEKRYEGQRSWDFDVNAQGFRYHMSNILAAIGRVQLRRLESEFGPKRISQVQTYKKLLSDNKNIRFQTYEEEAIIIPHIFPIRILNNKRDDLRAYLLENNIQTGIHYKPNHLLNFYNNSRISLPVTEKVYEQILSLPLHPGLEITDIELICNLINNFINTQN